MFYEFVLSKQTVMKMAEKRQGRILVAGIEVESVLLRLFCHHLLRVEALFQDRRKEMGGGNLKNLQTVSLLKLPLLFLQEQNTDKCYHCIVDANRDNSELISVALVSVHIY